MERRGARLTPQEADSLPVGTVLLYEDRASGTGCTCCHVQVKRYEQVGSVRLLVVELEDGTERSPASFSLFWP